MTEIAVLYLFTRVDGLRTAAGVCIVLIFIWAIIRACIIGNDAEEYKVLEAMRKAQWWHIVSSFLVCVGLLVVTPTKVDMAVIVGGKLLADAARSETANKVLVLVNETLDSEIAKLKPPQNK